MSRRDDDRRGKGSFNELLFAYLRFFFFYFIYIKVNAGLKNVCFLLGKFYNVRQHSIDNRDQKKCESMFW